MLQDQAGSGRRGEDKKRAKAAADDDDAGAAPLQAPSPGWSGKLAVAGPREAAPRPLVAVKLFPQAKKTAGELKAAKAKALKEAKSEAKALKALVADAKRAEQEDQDKVCLPTRTTSASCRGPSLMARPDRLSGRHRKRRCAAWPTA